MLQNKENEIKEKENEVEDMTDLSEALGISQTEDNESSVENGSESGDTFTPSQEEENGLDEQHESTPNTEEGPGEIGEEMAQSEKMLSQSQVNALIGKARQEGRDSAMKELFGRYGVSGDEELNDIFGRGQAYDDLNDEYNNNINQYKSVSAENALLRTGVPETRWEDVKLILSGKGLDINAENIAAMMETHPEWRGNTFGATENEGRKMLTPEMGEQLATQPVVDKLKNDSQLASDEPAKLVKLGNESSQQPVTESEEEKMRRIFGF